MSLSYGQTAPLFVARARSSDRYAFGVAGGRYVVLAFFPDRDDPTCAAALVALAARRALFDDRHACFFGVLRNETTIARAQDSMPGIRWFFDPAGDISRLYQEVDAEQRTLPRLLLLDPSLRVIVSGPMSEAHQVLDCLAGLPAPEQHAGTTLSAPVLILPRVFEPDFCRALIRYFESVGGKPSGTTREESGVTVVQPDPGKRRDDVRIADEGLRQDARSRVYHRLVPQIERAFQFRATRQERDLLACYDANGGGFFHPHRDNTTKGTAHRRFAVTINLNAEEYEGGDLRFPEFGSRTYRAPTGGAVIFSCSLLHEALPVTAGRRYAYLPFLYDEDAARIREANATFVDPAIGTYRLKD